MVTGYQRDWSNEKSFVSGAMIVSVVSEESVVLLQYNDLLLTWPHSCAPVPALCHANIYVLSLKVSEG